MLRPLLLSVLICASLPALADDISKVNGSISVQAGQTAGELDTVNGSIRVGDGATVTDAETVNGSVSVGDDVTIESIETVNGSIDVGARTRVAKDVGAVNGRVSLGDGAQVLGNLENVNGELRLTRAHVSGRVKTTSGGINVGADSRIDGGILVDKPSGWFSSSGKPPRIEIGPRAVIGGTLEFRREVELYVSDSARIGTITGATPKMFSGERP